jgi:hypothetical protein
MNRFRIFKKTNYTAIAMVDLVEGRLLMLSNDIDDDDLTTRISIIEDRKKYTEEDIPAIRAGMRHHVEITVDEFKEYLSRMVVEAINFETELLDKINS